MGLRHYRWTATGMEEQRFAVAEPDTYVKSLDMGRRVSEVKARIRRELLAEIEAIRSAGLGDDHLLASVREDLLIALDRACPKEG